MEHMNIRVLLADRAVASPPTGTVHLLNAGWSIAQLRAQLVGPPTISPMTVTLFVEAELPECNRPHALDLELWDQDGNIVAVPGPGGDQKICWSQEIVVPAPPGVPTGFPGHASATIEFLTGLALAPGAYRWQAKVDGAADPLWSARFYVMALHRLPTFGGS